MPLHHLEYCIHFWLPDLKKNAEGIHRQVREIIGRTGTLYPRDEANKRHY